MLIPPPQDPTPPTNDPRPAGFLVCAWPLCQHVTPLFARMRAEVFETYRRSVILHEPFEFDASTDLVFDSTSAYQHSRSHLN